jgi:hypothetical protein
MLELHKRLTKHICSVQQFGGFMTLVFRLVMPHPRGVH